MIKDSLLISNKNLINFQTEKNFLKTYLPISAATKGSVDLSVGILLLLLLFNSSPSPPSPKIPPLLLIPFLLLKICWKTERFLFSSFLNGCWNNVGLKGEESTSVRPAKFLTNLTDFL